MRLGYLIGHEKRWNASRRCAFPSARTRLRWPRLPHRSPTARDETGSERSTGRQKGGEQSLARRIRFYPAEANYLFVESGATSRPFVRPVRSVGWLMASVSPATSGRADDRKADEMQGAFRVLEQLL